MRGEKFEVLSYKKDERFDIKSCPVEPTSQSINSISIQALTDTSNAVGCKNFFEYIELSEQEVKNRLRKLLNETK